MKFLPTIAAFMLLVSSAGAAEPVADPLKASVVLRGVDQGGTMSVGSGTAVDRRNGMTLIVTAGHVVKDIPASGSVRVAFQDGQVGSGRVVYWTMDPDIGLVETQASPPAIATIAAANPQRAAAATRVGMFGVYQSQVVSLNRYLGSPNIQVSGVAIQGDSGGGIFNANGEMIGVCTNSDPDMRESLGPSLPVIQQTVQRVGIKQVACRWVRDQCGNWVQVCDAQQAQRPTYQQQPIQQTVQQPTNPPIASPPPAPTPSTPIAGPAGPQGPRGEQGPPGPAGKDGSDANCQCGDKWKALDDRLGKIEATLGSLSNQKPVEPPKPTAEKHIVVVADHNDPYWQRLSEEVTKTSEAFHGVQVAPTPRFDFGEKPQAVVYENSVPVRVVKGEQGVLDLLSRARRGMSF